MSNPSFSNIDRWLFELMEGNLTPEQEAQLEAFLLQHPELDLDKDMWEMAKVDQQEFVYPNQKKLERRRPIGLYMSMGFASIAVFLGIGVYTIFGNSEVSFGSEKQLVSTTTFNDQSKKASFQRAAQSIKTSLLNARRNESSNAGVEFAANEKSESKITTTPSVIKETSNRNKHLNSFANTGFVGTNSTDAYFEDNAILAKATETQSQEDVYASLLASDQIVKDAEMRSLTKLQTEEAKEIKTDISNKDLVGERNPSAVKNTFAKSEYKLSFGSRMNRMGRSIQRMMDNPVALKNMKDPYYHVPGLQAMDVNFGAVGTLLATRVQTVSRAQWLGKENQQLMNQISIDGYSYGMRGGLGFELNHNYYGTGGIQNYNAALIYSPKFSVARNVVVEPSIRFKMGTKKLDSDQIQTGTSVEYERMNVDQFYNDGTTPIGQTLWYKDLGAGLMVNTKWFFVGVQADNLFQHYDNIYSSDLSNPKKAATHFIGTIGTDYESSRENLSVSPYIVYQNQGKLSEGWLGVNFRYHWLTIGGAVSSDLEPAASLGLKFDHFMITYNADYTRSQMLNSSSLSHQVTIRFLSKPSRVGQRLLNQ